MDHKNKQKLDQEVDQTLTLFNSIRRVEGDPWLSTKAWQRMHKEALTKNAKSPFVRYDIRWAAVACLVLFNILFFSLQQPQIPSDDMVYESLSEEYYLQTSLDYAEAISR